MKDEFKHLENRIKDAKTDKTLRVILKMGFSKYMSIREDTRLSKGDKKRALLAFRRLKKKIAKETKK